jgi:hypothetical protein
MSRKAASGGGCRNRKDEAGMVLVCSGVVFQRLLNGDHVIACA